MPNVIPPPPHNVHLREPGIPEPRSEKRRPVDDAPLLPPVLSGPVAFLWLWVLPIAILLALNVEAYALIEGNMSALQRTRAVWLGVANAGNLLAGVALFFTARARVVRQASSATNLILRTAPALALQ